MNKDPKKVYILEDGNYTEITYEQFCQIHNTDEEYKKKHRFIRLHGVLMEVACHEFAERQGWTITKEYSEKGISGFKVLAEDRDAIQDLKTAALNKEFDVLLVFMFDRIGRIDDETPFVVEWFVHHGIEVWSVKEGEQRFDSHVDKLTNYIRFWQASGESAKTSARIKTRMQQMVEEGNYIGGSAPYGYRLVKRGRLNKKGNEVYDLEIDPAESEIVKMIFESTVKYGHGSFQLADRLNRMGLGFLKIT